MHLGIGPNYNYVKRKKSPKSQSTFCFKYRQAPGKLVSRYDVTKVSPDEEILYIVKITPCPPPYFAHMSHLKKRKRELVITHCKQRFTLIVVS